MEQDFSKVNFICPYKFPDHMDSHIVRSREEPRSMTEEMGSYQKSVAGFYGRVSVGFTVLN